MFACSSIKKPLSAGENPTKNGFKRKIDFSFSYAGMIQFRF
jgi:hypothetical protein